MKKVIPTRKFNFPKNLEVTVTSGFDEWRSFELVPDELDCLTFHISDAGKVFVEMLAYHKDENSYKNIHIKLSELKNIIEEVEQMASVTFDD